MTRSALDRETRARYTLQLACADAGLPSPLVSYRQLDVDVTDENDHSPQFERELYTVDISENNYSGAILVQVSVEILQNKNNV